MKLLLDTHAFIWWDSNSAKLPPPILDLLKNAKNEILVSLVSLWEMQIKTQLGKLSLRSNLVDIVQEQQRINDIQLLPILAEHIFELGQLPYHHKDPFDRLLIAQSRIESVPIISRDSIFESYDCKTIWEYGGKEL